MQGDVATDIIEVRRTRVVGNCRCNHSQLLEQILKDLVDFPLIVYVMLHKHPALCNGVVYGSFDWT